MRTYEQTYYLSLGDQVACIWSEVAAISRLLDRLIPLNDIVMAAKVTTTYLISSDNEGRVQLSRDDQCLYEGDRIFALLQYLMHDLTTVLVSHCQQALVFHAAGLALGAQGIICCGQSGHGKSTLSALLTEQRFALLSDEVVAVAPDGKQMAGLLRPIMFKADAATALEPILRRNHQAAITWPNQTTWLNPASLHNQATCRQASPSLLLFPTYQPKMPLAVRQLRPAEITFYLMQHLINGPKLPESGLKFVIRLAQQLPAYQMTYQDTDEVKQWLWRNALFSDKDKLQINLPQKMTISGSFL